MCTHKNIRKSERVAPSDRKEATRPKKKLTCLMPASCPYVTTNGEHELVHNRTRFIESHLIQNTKPSSYPCATCPSCYHYELISQIHVWLRIKHTRAEKTTSLIANRTAYPGVIASQKEYIKNQICASWFMRHVIYVCLSLGTYGEYVFLN